MGFSGSGGNTQDLMSPSECVQMRLWWTALLDVMGTGEGLDKEMVLSWDSVEDVWSSALS